jgi:hypothetical protein
MVNDAAVEIVLYLEPFAGMRIDCTMVSINTLVAAGVRIREGETPGFARPRSNNRLSVVRVRAAGSATRRKARREQCRPLELRDVSTVPSSNRFTHARSAPSRHGVGSAVCSNPTHKW